MIAPLHRDETVLRDRKHAPTNSQFRIVLEVGPEMGPEEKPY